MEVQVRNKMKKFLDNSLFKIVVMLVLFALTISSFQTKNNGIQYAFLGIFILYTGSLIFTQFVKRIMYIVVLIIYEIVVSLLVLQFESFLSMSLLATFIPLTISCIFLNELVLDYFKIINKRLFITIFINLLMVLALLIYVFISKNVNSFICIVTYLIIEVIFITILLNRKVDS